MALVFYDFVLSLVLVLQELIRVLVNRREATMFTRIFGKPKQETNALTTLDKLNEV